MPVLPTRDDVVHLFGPIADHTIVEILGVGASQNELEEVAMLLAQEDDILGDLRKPLDSAVGRVYEILMRDELYANDEDRIHDRG